MDVSATDSVIDEVRKTVVALEEPATVEVVTSPGVVLDNERVITVVSTELTVVGSEVTTGTDSEVDTTEVVEVTPVKVTIGVVVTAVVTTEVSSTIEIEGRRVDSSDTGQVVTVTYLVHPMVGAQLVTVKVRVVQGTSVVKVELLAVARPTRQTTRVNKVFVNIVNCLEY